MYSDTLSSVSIPGTKVAYSATAVAYSASSDSVNIPFSRNKVFYRVVKATESLSEKRRTHAYETVENFSSQESTLDPKATCIKLAQEVLETGQEDYSEYEDPYCIPASNEDELYIQLEKQQVQKISRDNVELTKLLGSGQFGEVQIGFWNCSPDQKHEVAIKTLNPTTAQLDAKVKFLQEAVIMAQFRHTNIIQLYGIVSDGDPVMLVLELAHKNDLRTHLHSLRQEPSKDLHLRLLEYSKQIAFGMKYLSCKSFVHRDLAARNVLVTKEWLCKIADFGMSRNLADDMYYVSKGGMVPVKWTAPEAIHYRKYSTASDVWSYGCLLYEIWSVGCRPFEGIGNAEVIEMIDSGYRLPPPPGCPMMVYQLMIECWNPEKRSRPSFRDIYLFLSQSPDFILKLPDEVHLTHPQAAILGAPLEAGQNMYIDHQKAYV